MMQNRQSIGYFFLFLVGILSAIFIIAYGIAVIWVYYVIPYTGPIISIFLMILVIAGIACGIVAFVDWYDGRR